LETKLQVFLSKKTNTKPMKPILSIILLTVLVSCTKSEKQKSITNISEIYKSKISYTTNKRQVTNGKVIWEYTVVVPISKLLDSLPKATATSNIAFLTFKNFNENEKKRYSIINVLLISSQKDTIKNSYDIPILETIVPKHNTYQKFSEYIINGDFNELNTLKNNKDIPESISDLIRGLIKNAESNSGKIIAYQPVTIAVSKDNVGEIFQFNGFLIFEKGNKKHYSISIDKIQGNDKIVGFNFFY